MKAGGEAFHVLLLSRIENVKNTQGGKAYKRGVVERVFLMLE